MAKNQLKTGESEIASTEELRKPDQPSYEDFEDIKDIQKIQEILGSHDISGGKIRLERKGPTDQVYQYVSTFPIESFDIDHIKKTFGGGDYYARTFRANGQMYKPFNFSIDYRFKGALDEQAIKQMAAEPKDSQAKIVDAISRMNDGGMTPNVMLRMMESSAKQQETSMMMLMKMMADSQERQMALIGQIFAAKSAPAPAPAQNAGFVEAITPILLEMIKSKSTSTPLSDSITMLKELKDVMRDDNEEREDSMFEKIMKVAGPLVPVLMGGGRQVSNGQSEKIISPPLPNRPSQRETSPPPTDDRMTKAKMIVALFTEQLIVAADKGSDPGIYFDLIVDALTEPQLLQLKQSLTGDDWCAKLFADDERVTSRISWFEELRQLILNDGKSDGTMTNATTNSGQNDAGSDSGPSSPPV